MVKSSTQSIKSGRATPNERSMTPTKNQSRSQSRRVSVAQSLHKAYGEVKKKGLYNAIPTRYVVVFVAALANTISYTMRTNMSVTIVAMVNHTTSSSDHGNSCPVPDDGSGSSGPEVEGQFHWDETMQGHILGSFYYGYIATNINGGQLADMFGARWLCGIVTLISAIFTLLTPVVARWDVNALILLRVGTGLCQGVLTPAIYSLLAYWIPKNERGLVLALIQVGGNLGAVVSTIFSGFLCKYGFDGGWPSVFYIFGIIGLCCFALWMICIYDSPDQHPRIHDDELLMIKLNVSTVNTKNSKNKKTVPWIAIMTSMPVWAISVAKFCGAWGNLMLMSKLPSYLKSVLHVSIQNNGYITSAVYIALSISLTGFGFISDYIGQKKLVSDTLSRKIFETIALVGPAICLIIIPQLGCSLTGLVTLLIVAMVIFGLNAGGDKPVVVDIAPDHSGTIYGITNAIASLPGILSPLVVGFLINLKSGIEGWNLVFYSAAGVYIFGMLFFLVFATAKPQPWGTMPRSRRATAYSRYSGNSRIASRAASRGPSRKATFLEANGSRAPSRRATFRQQQQQQSNTNSHLSSAVTTPHQGRKTVQTDPEAANNGDIYTIDLNKAVNKQLQQQLSDRIEGAPLPEDRAQAATAEVLDYEYRGDFEFDEDFDDDMDEEYLDEEEEKAHRLQFFRERRFSVFPIS